MYMPLLAVWAAGLLVAWIGTGSCTLRMVGLRNRSWALSGVVGAAIFVLIGGWLNLAGQVRPPLLVFLVLVGDLLFVADRISARSGWKWHRSFWAALPVWGRVLTAFCGAGLLVAATNSLTFAKFNTFDDLPAYLTFPAKLLQLGSLGFDPFSERRVQSGLGANYFLQAFMLIAGDVRSLWFPDAGAGLILFTGCVYFAGRRLFNSATSSMILAALVLLVPLSHGNLGMSVLPAALFTSLFLVETSSGITPLRKSLLVGLLGGTVTLLKSTYLPPSILMIAFLQLLRLRKELWRIALRDLLLCGLAYGVVMLPWMLDMKQKEGTLLYPLLGKGYEISAYGPVPHMVKTGLYAWELGLAALILLAGAGGVHWMVTRGREHADQVTALLLACGVSILPLSVSTAGASLLRYTTPFVLPCCLLLMGSLPGLSQRGVSRPRLLPLAYLYAGALLIVLGAYSATHSQFDLYLRANQREAPNFSAGTVVLEPADLQAERERAARIQAALPAGESVYADFMVTFPMDFRRNPIYVADFGGMASLPPGMPTQRKPEALRSYLLANHVRYIAYSVRLAELRQANLGGYLSSPLPTRIWPRMQAQNAIDVDQEIEALARTNRVIFDEGDVRVIELSK